MVDEDSLASVLSDFARTMVTDFPVQGILDRLVERIVEVLAVTGAGVTLMSPGMAPRYVAASSEDTLRFERLQTEIGEGPCFTAVETGRPVAVPDLAAEARYPTFAPAAVSAGMAAVFAFPLRHNEVRLGALVLYRDVPGALNPLALEAAQTLANVAAAYLLNAQAREQVVATADQFRDMSLHDALTGLPNRAALGARLEHASQHSRRTQTATAVLFVDLDHFKEVNETHGHAVGDELLVAATARLQALVRPGDTLARVSGDEFVFLCENLADASDVEVLVNRIDEAFVAPFALPGLELAAAASVGIAYSRPGEAVTDQLLLDADMAMYQAKRRGPAALDALRAGARSRPDRGVRRRAQRTDWWNRRVGP